MDLVVPSHLEDLAHHVDPFDPAARNNEGRTVDLFNVMIVIMCAFSVMNFSEHHRLLQVTTHSVAPLSSISSWSLRTWAALEQQGARNTK